MPFEVGHEHGKGPKPRIVHQALTREIIQNPEKLKAALAKVLDAAASGDLPSLDWITCRLEGKAVNAQAVDDDGRPVISGIQLIVVKADQLPNVIKDIPSSEVTHDMP